MSANELRPCSECGDLFAPSSRRQHYCRRSCNVQAYAHGVRVYPRSTAPAPSHTPAAAEFAVIFELESRFGAGMLPQVGSQHESEADARRAAGELAANGFRNVRIERWACHAVRAGDCLTEELVATF